MTIRDRIVQLLRDTPDGLDDEQIAARLGLRQRQQANSLCRQLEAEGLVQRRAVAGKIRNFWREGAVVPVTTVARDEAEEKPWFWEGNVQAMVASHLRAEGWHIDFEANTLGRQQGKDLDASMADRRLWVSCKGYPIGTVRTNAPTQARHWFSHAIFDMVLWHGEDPGVDLAIALPDFATYRRLASRASWLKEAAPFDYFWVNDQGSVLQQA